MKLCDTSIEARLVDITTLAVDAIVNAANTELSPGGGVCGAIHRAAGPELAEACAGCARVRRARRASRLDSGFTPGSSFTRWGPCGTAVAAMNRPCSRRPTGPRSISLRASHLRSIAFPAISTGIYGYPLGAATGIAVSTIRQELAATHAVERVIFACFNQAALEAYAAEGVTIGANGRTERI